MNYKEIVQSGADTWIYRVQHFDLDEILDCGQCFRWHRLGEKQYQGVAWGKVCIIAQIDDNLLFSNTMYQEVTEIWIPYFDLGRDYGHVKELLSQDENMARAIRFCPGMRVVRQEPWEALCSFIISQNNNIPRIKGIVERLCACFGDPLGNNSFNFPRPEQLALLEVDDLSPVRAGFRAKYILDAARVVSSGKLDLNKLYTMELNDARAQLQTISGVGPKVAECALLYGLGRVECVPVDVWIARALKELYPQGMPEIFAPLAGIGQQYLFHYMRHRENASAT